jgi:RNA polymerase sigma-70 factor (ECF subfamily)
MPWSPKSAVRRRTGGALADPDAFRTFYDLMLPRVYSYLFHRVGGIRTVAEDLTQETFMAAVEQINRRARVDHPDRWVMGIARHKLLDYYRTKARDEERWHTVVGSVAGGEAVMMWHGPEEWEHALEALAAVPATQRAALALRYFDDLPVADVAQALGRSVHATESLLARGRKSFRHHYAGGGNGQG